MVAFNLNGEAGVASITSEDSAPPFASMMTKDGFKLVPGKVMKKM
jgi:hypothetical protein